MLKYIFTGAAAIFIAAGSAAAQCLVSGSSNEGKLLAFYTAPIAFGPATAPGFLGAGTIRIGVEGEYLPSPSAAIQQTGQCFTQKSEHTTLSSFFGRPRVTASLPGGFSIEASYLPPIKVADAKPNLGSFAASENHHFEILPELGGADVMLRGHATVGNVKGPITCPSSSLQQSSSTAPCYGTSPSNDTFRPDMLGAEVVAGIAPPTGRFSYYVGAGVNRIDPHFQVGFRDGTGHLDSTRVQLTSPLIRGTLLAGVTAKWLSRLDLGLQVYSVPGDATTFRINGGWRSR
jgi:hypothetical protein